jgi:hypothetical protein
MSVAICQSKRHNIPLDSDVGTPQRTSYLVLSRVFGAGHVGILLCRVFVSEMSGGGDVNCFKAEHSVNEVHKWLGGDTAGWKGKHNRIGRFLGTRKATNSRSPQYNTFPCRTALQYLG